MGRLVGPERFVPKAARGRITRCSRRWSRCWRRRPAADADCGARHGGAYGRARQDRLPPRIHSLEIPELSLEPLAAAFFQVLTEPWKLIGRQPAQQPLQLRSYIDETDGVRTYQVEMARLDDIAAFCSFENFLGKNQGTGLLRYEIGRASNTDMMAVGMPLLFTTANRAAGLVTPIEFATVHFNGATGSPQSRTCERVCSRTRVTFVAGRACA